MRHRTAFQYDTHFPNFNPRTPCGVRHGHIYLPGQPMPISIHAPRVGCDPINCKKILNLFVISIHAPRVGCDQAHLQRIHLHRISIHAPRVGCDPRWCRWPRRSRPFQSTHPVWGATLSLLVFIRGNHHFNPRTPCGVRRLLLPVCADGQRFQSTHPVWGATTLLLRSITPPGYFNPRTPCGVRHALRDYYEE